MQVIRGNQLSDYLEQNGDCEPGCLADTGLLYAAAYEDDRLHHQASEVFTLFAEYDVQVYANVISRMEFVDLIFRKQITNGAIEVFENMDAGSVHKELFNLLKSIRDDNTGSKRAGQSYRVNEAKLKRLREEMEKSSGPPKWRQFCAHYAGQLLINEWKVLEEDLGLYFVEVLEGATSDIIAKPLHWNDMVCTMGEEGIRGPDAMIANLFLKSRLPLLITNDNDIARSFREDDPRHASKTILYLE